MNNKPLPEISVIMSVFNSVSFLAESIESILNQTFREFEFIITDDCSSDGSYEMIKSYAEKDSRIRYFRNQENLGLTKSLNNMLRIASGKYIARMDADDISMPDRFLKQYEFMENNPEIGVLGTNIRYFGLINRITDHPLKHDEIKTGLLFKCVMMHPSIMIRKSVIDENQFRYNEDFKVSQDYELWVRMISFTKFANLKDVLIDYRFENTNITNTQKEDYKNKLLNIIFTYQLENLEIASNETGFDPFNYLISNDKLSDFDLLFRIEKLLMQLLEHNNNLQIYKLDLFRIRISEKWFELCTRSTKFGMKVYSAYLKSDLSKDFVPGLIYKFKFFIKCLMKYERNCG